MEVQPLVLVAPQGLFLKLEINRYDMRFHVIIDLRKTAKICRHFWTEIAGSKSIHLNN